MQTYAIYHDLFIQASAQVVFDGVSLPEQLVNWWPQRCSGKPALGETYNFFFTSEYDWYGKVTECEPGKYFHIAMTQSDEDWENTSFGFDVQETQNGTQLQFWHKGWPRCNHHFRRSSWCWAILLQGLKNYLEKGVVIPFEERE